MEAGGEREGSLRSSQEVALRSVQCRVGRGETMRDGRGGAEVCGVYVYVFSTEAKAWRRVTAARRNKATRG